MGRIKILFALIFLSVTNQLHAYSDSTLRATFQKNIPGSFSNFYTDNLGNVYLITTGNQVKKYSDRLDSIAVFNDVRRYGSIYSMDVTNPLRVIVYYKDFTTVLILDRFLNTRNTIDLRSAGITQARAVAQSYDNSIWVFDELESNIKKIDEQGKIVFQSSDFRLLFDDAVNPGKLIDFNRTLYLYDIKLGWYLFDYYGAFQKKIAYPNWKDVQVFDKALTGFENNTVKAVNLNNPAADVLQINAGIDFTGMIKLQYSVNKLYVLRNSGLDIYLMQ